MPYDPTKPAANSPLSSLEMRQQLQSLFADIQTRITDPQLVVAIANALQLTSANSNSVGQMSLTADSTYNQAQIQQLMDKIDELIAALRRM